MHAQSCIIPLFFYAGKSLELKSKSTAVRRLTSIRVLMVCRAILNVKEIFKSDRPPAPLQWLPCSAAIQEPPTHQVHVHCICSFLTNRIKAYCLPFLSLCSKLNCSLSFECLFQVKYYNIICCYRFITSYVSDMNARSASTMLYVLTRACSPVLTSPHRLSIWVLQDIAYFIRGIKLCIASETLFVLQDCPVCLVQMHEVGVVLSDMKEHVRKYFSLGLQ